MTAETWTIGRLLTWTTDYLKQHKSDSPRLDAEVLLAHARGCPRIQLYANFEEVADDGLRARFRELVKKRAEGMPVAYLVGKREFYSLDFKVTPDVLIPRPETEHVVIAALDFIKERSGGKTTVCDVGTGSGCIAICLAKHAATAQVTAVDISPAALAVARENAAAHGVAEKIEFVESDLFAALPAERKFDVIASNPPYIPAAEYATLPAGVRDYEPRQALLAGNDGLEIIRRLLADANSRLQPNGMLVIELSPMLAEAAAALASGEYGYARVEILKDLAGQPRVLAACVD
jgi:release factor glutamine methyltransferase